eukprot:COSAG06_NODE_2821_length_6233_cov_6.865015_3_plen_477_part_00
MSQGGERSAHRAARAARRRTTSAATQRSAAALCACIGASPGAMDAVAGQPPAEDASRREALHALLRRDLIDPSKLVGSDIGPQSLAVLVCTAAQCGMDDEAGELATTAGGMTKQEDFFRALPGWAQDAVEPSGCHTMGADGGGTWNCQNAGAHTGRNCLFTACMRSNKRITWYALPVVSNHEGGQMHMSFRSLTGTTAPTKQFNEGRTAKTDPRAWLRKERPSVPIVVATLGDSDQCIDIQIEQDGMRSLIEGLTAVSADQVPVDELFGGPMLQQPKLRDFCGIVDQELERGAIVNQSDIPAVSDHPAATAARWRSNKKDYNGTKELGVWFTITAENGSFSAPKKNVMMQSNGGGLVPRKEGEQGYFNGRALQWIPITEGGMSRMNENKRKNYKPSAKTKSTKKRGASRATTGVAAKRRPGGGRAGEWFDDDGDFDCGELLEEINMYNLNIELKHENVDAQNESALRRFLFQHLCT